MLGDPSCTQDKPHPLCGHSGWVAPCPGSDLGKAPGPPEELSPG